MGKRCIERVSARRPTRPPRPRVGSAGHRFETSCHRRVKSELADANASNQRRHGSWVVGIGPGTDAMMGEISSASTFYRPPVPPW